MNQFLPANLERLVELNQEYLLATPSRRTQIENEILSLAPKELFPPSIELAEMSSLLEDLKQRLMRLIYSAEGSDLDTYNRQIEELSQRINEYANKLGVDISNTDVGKTFQDLLQIKFPPTN